MTKRQVSPAGTSTSRITPASLSLARHGPTTVVISTAFAWRWLPRTSLGAVITTWTFFCAASSTSFSGSNTLPRASRWVVTDSMCTPRGAVSARGWIIPSILQTRTSRASLGGRPPRGRPERRGSHGQQPPRDEQEVEPIDRATASSARGRRGDRKTRRRDGAIAAGGCGHERLRGHRGGIDSGRRGLDGQGDGAIAVGG